mmetsp:Transcript_89180/g.230172  ORF Transcript_89180/g.230172 Transcript_89180/m.230172 type:complete len:226 (-) Transcript_89180:198-875(-)
MHRDRLSDRLILSVDPAQHVRHAPGQLLDAAQGELGMDLVAIVADPDLLRLDVFVVRLRVCPLRALQAVHLLRVQLLHHVLMPPPSNMDLPRHLRDEREDLVREEQGQSLRQHKDQPALHRHLQRRAVDGQRRVDDHGCPGQELHDSVPGAHAVDLRRERAPVRGAELPGVRANLHQVRGEREHGEGRQHGEEEHDQASLQDHRHVVLSHGMIVVVVHVGLLLDV